MAQRKTTLTVDDKFLLTTLIHDLLQDDDSAKTRITESGVRRLAELEEYWGAQLIPELKVPEEDHQIHIDKVTKKYFDRKAA